MPSSKHIPFAILALILCSAIAVLILGIHFSKEEKIVVIEQDRTPLSNFTTQLLGEVASLESLYEKHLITIQDGLGRRADSFQLSSLCRRIVGIEQGTILRQGASSIVVDLRATSNTEPISTPRWSSGSTSEEGLIINPDMLKGEGFDSDFKWVNQPGYPPHFAARLNYKNILVLRINPKQVAAAADVWLAEWIPEHFDQVEAAGISTVLKNPAGEIIASTAVADAETKPDIILPVPSFLGNWKISSWAKKEIITTYRQPVLIGSATLAIVLGFAGVFGYAQQQRATRLAEQRVSFVNRVSHELRTPMTNILLNVDLLSDSLAENDAPRTKRLGLIREEASRLSRLLENVLTFSEREKIKSNPRQKLLPVSCDVSQLIDDVASQFAATLTRKKIAVSRSEPDTEIFALADPDAFQQIISNLVSNVEKYTADGGKLAFEIAASPSDETVTISVIDNGPGIAKSEAGRIFRPFVRLSDATTEGVSGTGLGLAIARDLARNMNGKLELISQPSGARFELTLPLAADNIISIAS